MMRQTIFENRKRQTSFLAFVFVLNPNHFVDLDFIVIRENYKFKFM